jgi:hypothetical protein
MNNSGRKKKNKRSARTRRITKDKNTFLQQYEI